MDKHSISHWQFFKVRFFLTLMAFFALLACGAVVAGQNRQTANLWALKPVVRPAVPAGVTQSTNPIDAFIAAAYKANGLTPSVRPIGELCCGACISISSAFRRLLPSKMTFFKDQTS